MQTDLQIQNLNKQAMDELRYSNHDSCLRNLQKAQDLLYSSNSKNISKLQAMTYNNLGCYYKAINKSELALSYLKKALKIENSGDFETSNVAGTHLNISAIYSQIGSHSEALTHAITALKLLKSTCTDGNYANMTTLIIALHNTGLEYEAIGNIEKAASTFKYGLELAQQYLGSKHQYTTALLKSFLSVTTTEKKYYFEKGKISKSRPNRRIFKEEDFNLPFMKKRNSQDVTHTQTINKKKNSQQNSLFAKSDNPTFVKAFRGMRTPNHETVKVELPGIEKPKTFGGRAKNTPNTEYVKTLERKVNFLQSQLANFEKRHKALEEIARKTHAGYGKEADMKLKDRRRLNKALGNDDADVKEKAARVIQRNWRAFKARKNEKIKKIRNKNAVDKVKNPKSVPIPEKKPGIKASSILTPKKRTPYDSLASSKFPSSMRNYALHPIAESKLENKSKNATVIQSNFRRFLQQKNFNQIKAATIKIQSIARRFICRRLFISILQAILFIQRSWRRYKLKKLKRV